MPQWVKVLVKSVARTVWPKLAAPPIVPAVPRGLRFLARCHWRPGFCVPATCTKAEANHAVRGVHTRVIATASLCSDSGHGCTHGQPRRLRRPSERSSRLVNIKKAAKPTNKGHRKRPTKPMQRRRSLLEVRRTCKSTPSACLHAHMDKQAPKTERGGHRIFGLLGFW